MAGSINWRGFAFSLQEVKQAQAIGVNLPLRYRPGEAAARFAVMAAIAKSAFSQVGAEIDKGMHQRILIQMLKRKFL